MRKENLKKIKSGFTLVELLVTLSIFAITTGIVMTSQGKFDNSVLLTNTAYDIAITIRQAQTYGVNVKESGIGGGNFFSYGVYFNTADKTRFNLFADTAANTPVTTIIDYKFNGTPSCPIGDPECVSTNKIKRGNSVSSICAGTDDADCDANPVNKLNISFERPNPEAIILVNDEVYVPGGTDDRKSYAKIVISSADGSASRSIVVTKVGQIYVVKK